MVFHGKKAASSARNSVTRVPLLETHGGLWFTTEVLYVSFPFCYIQSSGFNKINTFLLLHQGCFKVKLALSFTMSGGGDKYDES